MANRGTLSRDRFSDCHLISEHAPTQLPYVDIPLGSTWACPRLLARCKLRLLIERIRPIESTRRICRSGETPLRWLWACDVLYLSSTYLIRFLFFNDLEHEKKMGVDPLAYLLLYFHENISVVDLFSTIALHKFSKIQSFYN